MRASNLQRLTILGATGSIGQNTLEVVQLHPERFAVHALTAHTQVQALFDQCVRFTPTFAVMSSEPHARELAQRLREAGSSTQVLAGPQALVEVSEDPSVDAVMAAIVGAAGLPACLAAARAGKRLLLANKEALVVGGAVFMQAVQAGGATLLPIDSEHSAIFQCLPERRETWPDAVERLILTASGGPFRTWQPEALAQVTPEQACAHPNWVMGRKISVDSATMMNKALEVIEAHFLFGFAPEQIEVLIHPQSVIHSMVQLRDQAVMAQLGTPDMRMPIALGLSWPERMASGATALDFSQLSALTFETRDDHQHRQRFPGLQLAWDALAGPIGTTAVLNAANEVAVAAFLDGQLRFDRIAALNAGAMDAIVPTGVNGLADLLAWDESARRWAREQVRRWA